MLDAYRFIIYAAPESLAAAIEELTFKPHHVASTELAPGVALIEIEQPLAEWEAELAKRPPIFLRHMHPVHREVVLEGHDGDYERLALVAKGLATGLDPARPFAIQTRLLDEETAHLSRFQINETLATAVSAAGDYRLDVRSPIDVISVAVGNERAYLGVSPVAFNRSAWAGGAQRFAREQGQISRAEFKLLEAQTVFGFDWPEHGIALDLGAAPGGWTRLLRRQGLPVVAVDPAELDERLVRDHGVEHHPMIAQRFLPQTRDLFSVIVNDIRMDARDAAWLMLDAAEVLEDNGLAVVTLKLPQRNTSRIAYHALSILRQGYEIIGARQLFHNRSEVTVVLRRKDLVAPRPAPEPRRGRPQRPAPTMKRPFPRSKKNS